MMPLSRGVYRSYPVFMSPLAWLSLSWLVVSGSGFIIRGGFSVAQEAVKVEAVAEEPAAGLPVRDHYSCHQVRQRKLEEVPKSKNIAVLIPFREQSGQDRHLELAGLLDTLLPYGQKIANDEGVRFKVFVVEQSRNGHFNRGALMNVGFQSAQNFFGGEAFSAVAQDCDFVPDEAMIQWYSRSGEGPIHLASYAYCQGFGGVTIFSHAQYLAMDGYSHKMWGWGGEDDDAMDRWMSDSARIVLVPAGGERFKDLGKSEDKFRDKQSYDKSMRVWTADNQNQNWVREGLAGLQFSLLDHVSHVDPMVEHLVVELGGSSDSS